MASTDVIVEELMREFGKSSSNIRMRIEEKVGDIVVDLLTQNDGRFKSLEKTQTISIVVGTKEYRLPVDFNTAKKTFYEVNSDGNIIEECSIVPKANIHRRKMEGRYAGYRIGRIQHFDSHEDGRGMYLVLADESPENTTFEFDYYRMPTKTDTDLIRSPDIIKTGVRKSFPEYNINANYDLEIYLRMKSGFKENPEKFNTTITINPSRRAGSHNRSMRDIGNGG